MNRAEELKQSFKMKSRSNPDELLARYSREHSELREALQLATIAEIRVRLKTKDLTTTHSLLSTYYATSLGS